MIGIARLKLGQHRPDGRRPYTAVDSAGRWWTGLLDDPELVDDYLGYLDAVGRERPIVAGTGTGTGAGATAQPRPSASHAAAPVLEQPWTPAPIPPGWAGYLVATAARAPSVHNTQPWRFRVNGSAVELYADPGRALARSDPARREMLISCGAALYGLRLAVRRLGYLPVVQLLPAHARPHLLARVLLGPKAPITRGESALLTAIAHRHTHRGPFGPGPLPRGMLAGLQGDAVAEGATLVLLGAPGPYQQLARLVAAAERGQREDPILRAERRRWTRPFGSQARDGIPALAYQARPAHLDGGLAPRDFDLGRGWGQLGGTGSPPAMTAVLITAGDDRAAWLRVGQALHRLLVHAASQWVFASLHTQPLESASLRAEVRARLGLPGAPQMVPQFGRADVTGATARRPVSELLVER